MRKINFYSLVLFAIVLCCSCSHRMIDFTIISTKNVDLSRSGNFQKAKMRSEGKDLAHIVLFIPTGSPNMKEAIDRAIEKIPGAVALVDGVVYSKSWWAFLYGQSMYIVEGTPLIDPSFGYNQKDLPEYMEYKFDKNGEVTECKEISEERYLALKKDVTKKESLKESLFK